MLLTRTRNFLTLHFVFSGILLWQLINAGVPAANTDDRLNSWTHTQSNAEYTFTLLRKNVSFESALNICQETFNSHLIRDITLMDEVFANHTASFPFWIGVQGTLLHQKSRSNQLNRIHHRIQFATHSIDGKSEPSFPWTLTHLNLVAHWNSEPYCAQADASEENGKVIIQYHPKRCNESSPNLVCMSVKSVKETNQQVVTTVTSVDDQVKVIQSTQVEMNAESVTFTATAQNISATSEHNVSQAFQLESHSHLSISDHWFLLTVTVLIALVITLCMIVHDRRGKSGSLRLPKNRFSPPLVTYIRAQGNSIEIRVS